MICLDTTFLVDLWRERDLPDSAARELLQTRPGEEYVVPAHAAGEFLEGGAVVSRQRFEQSLTFLRLFRVGDVSVETASRYALIVSDLRRRSELAGRSKPDLWIAAWAVQHNAPLATRNPRHFGDIPGLDLIGY
jgi:predicted nucleic acid-binding protein